MSDIKRNNETPKVNTTVPAVVETHTERKPLPGNSVKKDTMQVHFGNVEGLKLKMLESISLGIQTLCNILDPDGIKRKEIEIKRQEFLKKHNG